MTPHDPTERPLTLARRTGLLMALAFLAACEARAPAGEADREAIGELFTAWSATFNAQDLAGLRSYYPPDAVMMPPNAPPLVGPDRIVDEWFGPMFAAYATEISLTSEETQVDRQWGFVRGTYVVRAAPKAGGAAVEERGSFLDLVSRGGDGQWKIARAIWHSDSQ